MAQFFPDIISKNLSLIIDLCKRHHVAKLWVFGSVLRNDFRDNSDIDFLYEWDDNIEEPDFLDNLYKLLDSLETVLDRKIDWIAEKGIKNPYLKQEIESTKVLIYDQNLQKVPV